jgi:protein TonB
MNNFLMRHVTVVLLMTIALTSSGQKLKLVKSESKERPRHKEEYYVLESDPNVKHGGFEGEYAYKFAEKGQYDNGVKSGVWEYSSRGELVQKIDFTNRTVLFEKPHEKTPGKKSWFIEGDTFVENNTGNHPHLIGGFWKMAVLFANTLTYPAKARRSGTQGVVEISCIITEAGELIEEKIEGTPDETLAEEALRVIKLMPDEWIPAIIDGKPVKTRIIIPVTFKMEN